GGPLRQHPARGAPGRRRPGGAGRARAVGQGARPGAAGVLEPAPVAGDGRGRLRGHGARRRTRARRGGGSLMPAGRLLTIAWKELVQLRRDRLTLGMVLVLPMMQLMLFGYAINTDVRHIPLLVYDQDVSAASRDLARSLEASGSYRLVGAVADYQEMQRAL